MRTPLAPPLPSLAPGQNAIPPLGLKRGGPAVASLLHRVITAVWRAGSVPASWRHALITPLPKKGSRFDRGNYRRISLLDVESKVYLLVLLARIRGYLDACFLDEQHGFRPNRGPGDGQFCFRRLVEVAASHAVPVFAGLVDFKQAFDSLDRATLWALLQAYGVHPKLVALLQDLYDGSTASVRANGHTSPPFPVTAGVRQGCPLSPTLFNVYMDFVARAFLHQCQQQGLSGFSIAYRPLPSSPSSPSPPLLRQLALLL